MTFENHTITELSDPTRLQDYGFGVFTIGKSKSAWKKLLKKGLVEVNDKIANSATLVSNGDSIRLKHPEIEPKANRLELKLEVIYEDDYLAVIDKPAGILVSGNKFKTVGNALEQNLQKSKAPNACRPQPVHRLDYPTTGCLLVGKTTDAIVRLNKLFEDKLVEKHYLAASIGGPSADIELKNEVDDKAAHSIVKVLATEPSARFGSLVLLDLEPKTGRRHQLRKHLAGIGHPILGDKDYGIEGLILNGKGLYLHAKSLAFKHPFTGAEMKLESEVPDRFKRVFTSAPLGDRPHSNS